MNRLKYGITLLFALCSFGIALAQQRNQIRITPGHLVLVLDMRSDKAEIDSLLRAAGASNLNSDMILSGRINTSRLNGWRIRRTKKYTIELERALPKTDFQDKPNPYVLTSSITTNAAEPGYPSDVVYGVNSFSKLTVREIASGFTRFFFPGHLTARRVQLSGNFNSWTTIKGIMTKTDSGWVNDVKLPPGVYAYKFIVNGQWYSDAANNLKEADGYGSYNSIYYRCNYTFRLNGYAGAQRVTVAGTFNRWNTTEITLVRKDNGWEKRLYLHEGVYLYRFLVDGTWMNDPENKTVQTQGKITASLLALGESVTFQLRGYPDARSVYVAGDFNNWNANMLPMQKSSLGWLLSYTLPSGNYNYKFWVDGRWITDPQNPHTSSTRNNTTSFLGVNPNHTFVLKGYNAAKTVRLAGSFNDWNTAGYTLEHSGNEWHISMRLKPGKYTYKFIVDGQWIIDPGNRQWEQNEFDTGNSVLWIDL